MAAGQEYAVLEVRDLHKHYPPDKDVLRGVSLSVERDEILCLLGPSGCGKSTLLRIVAGLERADGGSVLFDGAAIDDLPTWRRGFGLMFQDYALFPHMTVAENVGYGLRMAGMPSAQRTARVDALLDLVNLHGYGDRTIDGLSGGEQQRVALARTLAPQPALVMLDEPLANLDRLLREELVQEVRAILKHLRVPAIFVTHDQEEAFVLADRIAVMRAGRIEQEATPARLYRRPANTFVAGFLGFQNLVTVEHAAGRPQDVVTPAGSFTLHDGVPAGSLAEWRLLIPPDAVLLEEDRPGPEYAAVAVVVQSLTFRGSVFRIAVSSVNAPPDDTLIFEFRNRGRTTAMAPGQAIRLWVDQAHLVLVPKG